MVLHPADWDIEAGEMAATERRARVVSTRDGRSGKNGGVHWKKWEFTILYYLYFSRIGFIF